MSSSAKTYGIAGSQFSGAVDLAASETTQAEKHLSLPDGIFGFLTSLPGPRGAAEEAEFSALLSENHSLLERVKNYANRKLAELRVGLLADHEAAKAAVRAQLEVIETLRQQHADVAREWYACKERTIAAKLKLDTAQQEAQSLSRFSSSAVIAKAQKAWREASEEYEKVAAPEGLALQEMNNLNLVLIPEQLKKRDELVEQVNRLSALLAGQDPDLATLGFISRA
jgi:hypothetical protein